MNATVGLERFLSYFNKPLTKANLRYIDKPLPKMGSAMKTSDAMRGLRGGVLYDATGAKESTVRAWVANNDLRLGIREDRRHPRYNLTDVAIIVLMDLLTSRLAMQAATAVRIVNDIAGFVSLAAEAEMDAIDTGVFAGAHHLVTFDRINAYHRPEVLLQSDYKPATGLIVEVMIDLRSLVSTAREKLCQQIQIFPKIAYGDWRYAGPMPQGGN